jgi:hypothetical protein
MRIFKGRFWKGLWLVLWLLTALHVYNILCTSSHGLLGLKVLECTAVHIKQALPVPLSNTVLV